MKDFKEVLFTEETIMARVKELAQQIDKDYSNSDRPLVCIAVLRGSVFFFSDLLKSMKTRVFLDFIAISSYGNSHSTSGNVRLNKDLSDNLEGKHVILIEDIVDSGLSLEFLKKHITAQNPYSLKICCLLDKPARRKTDIKADYTGFEVPDEFLVGYGLDYAQRYRNLPFIAVLKPEIYQ